MHVRSRIASRGRRRLPMRRLTIVALVACLTTMAAACSTSNDTGGSNGTSPGATTSAPPASGGGNGGNGNGGNGGGQSTGLTGTWKGSYGGSFSGTFTLHWTQSGSKLRGTIDLSTGGTEPINGTVNGSTIKFGTVGSSAIQYSGTASGDSMSGTYKVQGSSAGGNWSAHRA